MKLGLLIASAFGLAAGFRFSKTVDGETRVVRSSSSGTGYREYQFRPSNQTFDFKTSVGVYGRTAPFVRTQVFNQTNDSTPKLAYRVGVVRLAELVGFDNALNATNGLSLNSTGGSRGVSTPFDRTVSGTTIKSLQCDFTASSGTLPRTTVRVKAEIPLANVTEAGVQKFHNETKWTLAVNNFKYQATGDSKLAIVLSVNSPSSKSLITENGAITGVNIADGNATFTWNSTILVNNVAKSVIVTDLGASTNLTQANADSSTITGETAHFLQFVIDDNKPNNIFWDPTNGWDEDRILENNAASLFVSFGAVAAAVIAILA